MSENQSGFNPFSGGGSSPKVEAYKWGFNFKSIKGANTDMTYGWKGSGVFGLSTSVYVSPAALLPIVLGGVAAGAYVGAVAANDPEAGMAYGTAAVTAPFVTMALAHMIFPTTLGYKSLMATTSFLYPGSMIAQPVLSLRKSPFPNMPAYMTCEMGAKTDFIFGNKYDYCTGSVNKTVNGETAECYGDKVEWYHANLYKYTAGKETKMDWKGQEAIEGANRDTIYALRNDYINAYNVFAQTSTVVAAAVVQKASKSITQDVPGGPFTLTADAVTFTIANALSLTSATATASLVGASGVSLGATAGPVELLSGGNKAVEITAAQTKINNMLVLGNPGVGVPPNVANALAALTKAQADLTAQLAQVKTGMVARTAILNALSVSSK